MRKIISIIISMIIVLNNSSYIFALPLNYDVKNNKGEINKENETIKSEIKWTSSDEISLGSHFDKMNGLKALDKSGADLTDKLIVNGDVDTSKPGKYKIEYSFTDSDNNLIKAEREINVLDSEVNEEVLNNEVDEKNPIISSKGDITVYKGELFDPKFDINATDSNKKDITNLVKVEGVVDTNTIGSYKIKYSVTDESGRKAKLERTVKVIEKNIFNIFYEKLNEETKEKIKELGFSFYIDNNNSKFVLENQSENQLDSSNPKETYLSIKLFDKDNKEKLSLDLLGEDTGNSEKLDVLKNTKYEYGDFIEIKSKDPKNDFSINGDIQGDINLEKEDYSDGVDNLDWINNVRFQITEDGIKSVYNNAPVIHGLSDLKDIKDKNVDLYEGISVTDDHDKNIPTSNIKVNVEQKDSKSAKLIYIVEDSWGRKAIGTRNLFAINKHKTSNTTNDIDENIITVSGIEYSGSTQSERFKINFDYSSKEIKIIDADGRTMGGTTGDEYFRFELYDKNMNLKRKVVLNKNDKSDSEKLEALNNSAFEDGDIFGIWHAENKLKIGGNIKATTVTDGNATANGTTLNYSNGLPEDNDPTKYRFRIKDTGLEELKNSEPVFGELSDITISRGDDKDFIRDVTVTDDYDKFDNASLESGEVSIDASGYDVSKVGKQKIRYTATDKWGLSSTAERNLTVTSNNPLDNTYLEFKYGDNDTDSFKIRFDPLTKKLFIDNLDSISDNVIDSSKDFSIFKMKVYGTNGTMKKSFNIKGTHKLKTILSKIEGYSYEQGEYIQLWANEPKNLSIHGQLLKNDGENPENYTDGIDNIDYMNNVRFKIQGSSLDYVYNKAPVINITEELSVTRMETVTETTLKTGITANDDHDRDLTSNIKVGTIDTTTSGVKKVKYSVKDSWGRNTFIYRDVKVNKINKLEHNDIEITNSNNEVIFSLEFDDYEKNIKLKSLDISKIDSENTDKIFTISIFSKTRRRNSIEITKNDLISGDINTKLEDISYRYDEYISLKYTDINHIKIDQEEEGYFLNGFEDEEKMFSTRFKIKLSGLESVYNNAPEIKGIDQLLYVLKGESLDDKLIQGVTVEDDHDVNIDTSNITFEGKDDIDTNQVGSYTILYKVSDSWGKSVIQKRDIVVLSKAATNDIEIYSNGDNDNRTKLLSIRYNPITERLVPTYYGSSTPEEIPDNPSDAIQGDSSNGTTRNQPDTSPDGSIDDTTGDIESGLDKVFGIGIYNQSGEIIEKINLTEDELLDNTSLNRLNRIEVLNDYHISVWSSNQQRVNIVGNVLGNEKDNDKGINSDSSMNNVRFKLTLNGFEYVYNDAPEIIIRSRAILTAYAGDPIDYLQGVTVKDDHDTISPENIDIDVVKENREESLVIGDNNINLTISDSWGKTTTVTRKLKIENGIKKNLIRVQGLDNDQSANGRTLEIGFNPETNRLDVVRKDITFANGSANISGYFIIKILRPNQEGTLEELHRASLNSLQHGTESSLDFLTTYEFEYGDIIEIYHGHPNKLYIDGRVVDSREDYSDAVQNPENLLNTTFEITKSGLKAKYTNPDEDKITDNKNIIGPMAPEKFPFKLQVVPSERKFKIIDKTATQILYGNSNDVYKLVLIRSDSNGNMSKIKESTFRGNTEGTSSNEINSWNDYTFNYGDYLYVWHLEPHRSIIKGYIKDKREDYSNGVDNPDNMNHVIFKLTQTGMESVYNNAPEISGAEDIDVFEGQTFNSSNGVTYTDDYDTGHLTTSIAGNIDTNTLGKQSLTYTATDRWGKTTTVIRNVTVRPKLYKNVFQIFSSDESISEPIFKIGFDTVTSKYKVYDRQNEILSTENDRNTAFEIVIIGPDGNEKEHITLNGNDSGTSYKLDPINETEYSEGDLIRVFRSDFGRGIQISGPLSSEDIKVPRNGEELDYIKNTGYKVKNSGLELIYNNEPIIEGLEESKSVSYGDTINFLDGVSVRDDLDDDLSTQDLIVLVNGLAVENEEISSYRFDTVGTYTVSYLLIDSWGRATQKDLTVKVESKVKHNFIDVYDESNNKVFSIGFDSENNKLKLIKPNDNNVSKLTKDTTEIPGTSNDSTDGENEEKYFSIILRDIKGKNERKIDFSENQLQDDTQLNKINEISYSKYDTISIKAKNPNTVKITGSVINNSTDYTNGFGSIDKYSKVRFKIRDSGLEEITDKGFNVQGLGDLTHIRGEEIDLQKGVIIQPKDTNNQDYELKINQGSLNINKEGQYTVTYTITNSWGNEYTHSRNVIVKSRDKLEEVKLIIKKIDGNNLMTIGFDQMNNKLRVIDVESGSSIGNSNDIAFRLNAYNENGDTIANLELKQNTLITEPLIERINNFEYAEGYRLSIWSKDPSNNLVLEGDIEGDKYTSITDINDKFDNGRFEITENGLKYIYNEAPTISGSPEVLEYYNGSALEVPDSVIVNDDHDQLYYYDVGINDDDVDYDTLGQHDITYTVEDSWGRVGTAKGKLNLKSSLDNDTLNIFTISGEKAVTISLNDKKFNVQKNNLTETNPTKTTGNSVTLELYGKDKQLKKSINLNGNITEDSAELDKLNDYPYEFGDRIAIKGITEDIKTCIRIVGTVVNGLTNYENGVDNLNYIENVRFELTTSGFKSIYNEAPEIKINTSETLSINKGDEFPIMRNVRLKDDHDALDESNIKIIWNKDATTSQSESEENSQIQGEPNLGTNTATYIVTDSWGRSTEINRTVNVTDPLLTNTMYFRSSTNNILNEIFKMKFENNESEEGKFNIKLADRTNTTINNKRIKYFGIKIYNPDGSINKDITLYTDENGNSNKLDPLNNLSLYYGSKIELYIGHPHLFKIDGIVRDAREDYSDGVQNPENITITKFQVNNTGIKAILDDPLQNNMPEEDNIIGVVAKEKLPIQYKIDASQKRITIAGNNNTELYSELGSSESVFRLTLKRASGSDITINANANTTGTDSEFNKLNNQTFEYGDTITIWHKTPKRLVIKGNVKNAREDYSDGIDNSSNMEEAIFELTENGIVAKYDSVPRIKGMKDAIIFKGEELDLGSITSELKAFDDIDGDLTDRIQKDTSNVNTNVAGLYDIIYEVTNDRDRTARRLSSVIVYAKPEISLETNTLELGSVEHDEASIKKYLLSIAKPTDDEDDAKGRELKVDILEQDINPNQEGVYKAKYKVTDSDGHETEKEFEINVTRTISVSVPTVIPFQVVTNLNNKDSDPFISGVMKVNNNNTTPVNVSLHSFTKESNSGDLELVDANTYADWNSISKEESMTKMALGMYVSKGFNDATLTKENPLWLKDNMNEQSIGKLRKANSLSEPLEAEFRFTSRHGKNFKGGNTKGKFNLTFRFE